MGTKGTLLLITDIPSHPVLGGDTQFLKIELYGMFSSENGKWAKKEFFTLETITTPATGTTKNMSLIPTGLGVQK